MGADGGGGGDEFAVSLSAGGAECGQCRMSGSLSMEEAEFGGADQAPSPDPERLSLVSQEMGRPGPWPPPDSVHPVPGGTCPALADPAALEALVSVLFSSGKRGLKPIPH